MDTDTAKAALSGSGNWMQTAILLIVLIALNVLDGNRFDRIDARLDDLSERMARVETAIQGIDRRLDSIEGRLLRLENHIFKIEPPN